MTSNTITLTGVLAGFPTYGNKKPLKTRQRRGSFGTVTEFRLALVSPFGETFDIALEAGQATSGIEVIQKGELGEWFTVEGVLATELMTDRRFATDDVDDGRSYADLRVLVGSIRPAAEQRANATITLSGSIDAPVSFVRHHRFPDVVVGRTQLRTGHGHVSTAVPVVVGVDHSSAGALYRLGNRVSLSGTLLPLMIDQRGPDVEDAIERLDAAWNERKGQIEEKDRRRAIGHYRGQRASLMESPRLFVVADSITIEAGQEITAEVASAQRRAFQRIARKEGRGRLQQRLRNGVLSIEQVVEMATKQRAEPSEPTTQAQQAQQRPRRNVAGDTGSAAPAVLPEMEMAVVAPDAEPVAALNGSHDE